MKVALLVILVMGMLDAALGVCPTPESIEYGYHDAPGGYSEGSIITYHCNDDYVLSTSKGGSLNNTCISGAWENTPPFCGEDCINPQNITHGTVQLLGYGVLIAQYSCDDGYGIVDPGDQSYRQCTAYGFLDGERPTCYKNGGCSLPPDMDNFAHGTINHVQSQPGSPTTADVLHYYCDDGYTVRFNMMRYPSVSRSCKYPDWVGSEPYCELEGYCKKPVDPENGHASYSDHKVGDNVTYSCDAGYELQGGEAFQMCNWYQNWEYETNVFGVVPVPPTCVIPDSDSGSGSDSGHVVPWRIPAWRDNKYKGNAQLREKRRDWCKSYLSRHYKSHFWHPYQQ